MGDRMKYEGDLYGHLGGRKYIKLKMTSKEVDDLRAKLAIALTALNEIVVWDRNTYKSDYGPRS